MRISIDVGGTFTDIVVDPGDGALRLAKASTTHPDPLPGLLNAVARAAADLGLTPDELLSRTDVLFHSTTRAINAVVTGRTAKTAFLASEGHPDSLLIREGGRTDPFNWRVPYPDPYIPRSLTYEVPGRIWADGREVTPLDEAAVIAIAEELKAEAVEAVAVTLLWSIVNPAHEERVAALLETHLPGIPYTLSHRLNPTIREYRRASSTAIDASLKPVMSAYLRALEAALRARGLKGEIFAVTSQGGLVDLEQMADRPILALNSGPSMAPVAGRAYAALEEASMAIVTDAGGTTYDVSLSRDGAIPWTRETWLGPIYAGHITGFPSVDVKSVGAGGGSIASVAMGVLKVGPESAGSDPGPIAYGRGGTKPTVTDAALVLGYIDPDFFLGGEMHLAADAAREAIAAEIAAPLGISVEGAAAAILELSTEQMVSAIEEITVKQGIDPEETVLVAGGGASGLNAVRIGRRLGCASVIVPDVGAVLSAAGAMLSEMTYEFTKTEMISTAAFAPERARAAVADLKAAAAGFFARAGAAPDETRIDTVFEGRYPSQVWEIEVPLNEAHLDAPEGAAGLVEDFHRRHTEIFSFRDDGDQVEILSFRAIARGRVGAATRPRVASDFTLGTAPTRRPITFTELGTVPVNIHRFEALEPDDTITGPAIIESSFTTIVLPPGERAVKRADGHLVVPLSR